jgi:hypothetical protein
VVVVSRGARASLVVALLAAAGCDQSLFDSNTGDDDQADGAVAGGADASVLCPAPCVGDAVGEFSRTTQGGTTQHWGYRADQRADNGAVYMDLVASTVATEVPGWASQGTPPAGIASCNDAPGASVCAGLADYLLFEPSVQGGDARDPVLSFAVPESGVYHLTGSYRLPEGGATGVDQQLVLSRNARRDVLLVDRFTPSQTPGMFDVQIEAAAGDRLLLMDTPAASGAASPIGVRFFASLVSTPLPGLCEYTATFDGADEAARLKDRCQGFQWVDDGTMSVPSVSPELGTARLIDYGKHLQGVGKLDRSGDFTIQFWFKDQPVPDNALERPESVFADHACDAKGIWLTVYDGGGENNWDLALYDREDWCFTDVHQTIKWTQEVEFDAWHFVRLVRSTSEGTFRVCVDGQPVGTPLAIGASEDLTASTPPYLGMGGSEGAADTSGIIDDFRAFQRALPCEAP